MRDGSMRISMSNSFINSTALDKLQIRHVDNDERGSMLAHAKGLKICIPLTARLCYTEWTSTTLHKNTGRDIK